MPETLTDAEVLRAAAEKLRGFIALLGDNGGPWTVGSGPTGHPQTVSNIGVPYIVCTTYTDPGHPPTTARFIARIRTGRSGGRSCSPHRPARTCRAMRRTRRLAGSPHGRP